MSKQLCSMSLQELRHELDIRCAQIRETNRIEKTFGQALHAHGLYSHDAERLLRINSDQRAAFRREWIVIRCEINRRKSLVGWI